MQRFGLKTARVVRHTLRRGFTMVELMVVIAIGSIIMAITFGGYRSFATGNQRVACQTNLQQVYSALRLYTNDYDGFVPLYKPGGSPQYLGLWSLYAMHTTNNPDQLATVGEQLPGGTAKPIGIYLRNHKQLHCPADVDNEDRFLPGNTNQFNVKYLSYQGLDDMNDSTTANDQQTYQPFRGLTATGSCPQLSPGADPPVTAADRAACRQLIRYDNVTPTPNRLRRTPDDTTVVTWCRWHRTSRPIDNVLFYDGVVRPVPRDQDDIRRAGNTGGGGVLTGWQRVP